MKILFITDCISKDWLLGRWINQLEAAESTCADFHVLRSAGIRQVFDQLLNELDSVEKVILWLPAVQQAELCQLAAHAPVIAITDGDVPANMENLPNIEFLSESQLDANWISEVALPTN